MSMDWRIPFARYRCLALSCLLFMTMLFSCSCGFFLPGGGQVTKPSREKQNVFNVESKDERDLNKLVDPYMLMRFTNGGSGALCDLAAERGLDPRPAKFFTFIAKLPSTFSAGNLKGTDRYLADKLEESRNNGYDFSSFSGKKLAGQTYVFSGVGFIISYVVLLDSDAKIAGLWEDTYDPSSEAAEAGTHWTFFNIVDY